MGELFPFGAAEFDDPLAELVTRIDPKVAARVAGVSVREARDVLGRGSLAEVRDLFGGDARRAWTAVVADPGFVTLEPEFIRQVGQRFAEGTPEALRVAASDRVAGSITRMPFALGNATKNTVQGRHVIAQQFAARFNADSLQRRHVREAQRLVDELVRDYRAELRSFTAEMGNLFRAARTPEARKLIEARILAKEGLMQDRLKGLLRTTEQFEGRVKSMLGAQAEASFQSGVTASINRSWDLHTLQDNGIGAVKDNLSLLRRDRWRAEIAAEFFTARGDDLRVALVNEAALAGRVAREARDGIRRIIAKTSILRGSNSRYSARDILNDYGRQLRGTRLSVGARARFIARTETARVQGEGDLLTQAEQGVRFVDVFYSGGAFPCEICPSIADGGPYQISPFRQIPSGGIPFHPNCRCSYAPVPTEQAPIRSPLWHQGDNRAADGVVLASQGGRDHVLMIKRQDGSLALPGGFVNGNAAGSPAALRTARRELVEETQLKALGRTPGVPLGRFSDPGRDPRASFDRSVSSRPFMFDLGRVDRLPPVAGADDALAAKWVPVSTVETRSTFADHGAILRMAMATRSG